MKKTFKICHLTSHLGGGVGRVLLNYLSLAKDKSAFNHDLVISLDYINNNAKIKLKELNIDYFDKASQDYKKLIEVFPSYDIIFIHWWNHPLMYEFLVKCPLPKCRVIMWSHISGLYCPSNFTEPLFNYADKFIFTTPISYEADVVKRLSENQKEKLSVVWSTAGVEHVKDVVLKKHIGFIIGYLGTVDYSKLHKDFLYMSAKVNIEDSHFIICGGEDEKNIEKEAILEGINNKFEFTGQVSDIIKYLEQFDIFGYPLSPYHFGTCDQVLAEAMACGIVPVVFNNPMENYMVEHNTTGLIVSNGEEYKDAIEKLYNDKEFRCTLSKNAKDVAFKRFSLDNMVKEWEKVFEECIIIEKRTKEWDGKYKGIETTPFQLFIESTGVLGKYFEDILFSKDIELRNKAEKKIKEIIESTHSWKSKSKGTLNHYLYFFEDDNLKKLNSIIGSNSKKIKE